MVNSLYMYLLMLLFSVLFKAGWKKRLLLCLIGLVLNASAETCALYLMAFLFNTTSYNVINDQTLWTGGAITTIIFALLFANMVRVKYKNQKLLQTTKSDKENHGFGLDNIKQALSKYNHVVKIEHAGNEFVLSFIIFNNE